MNIESSFINLIISLFAISSIVYVIVGVYYWKIKPVKNTSYFSLFLFAAALYSFGYFIEINSRNADMAFLLRNFQYLGTVFVPTFFILFIIQTTKIFSMKRKLSVSLYSISLVIWLLYVTDPYLHLFYKSMVFSVDKYGGAMLTEKNFGYYLLLLYFVIMLVFSSIILYKAAMRTKTKNSKKRFEFLFYTFQVSWLAILFIVGGLDVYVDPTPLTIMIMCGMFAGNAVFNDMYERNIIRWSNNYSTLNNPAFLVDSEEMVVCSNNSANKLADELNKSLEDIISVLNEGEKNRKPVLFTINGMAKWIDVKKSTLNTKGTLTNYLLIDVTEEKSMSLITELFFNAIGDFVFITTPSGEILFVNNEVRSKLGFDNKEISKMHITDLSPKELRNESAVTFDKMLVDNTILCHLPLCAKSGEIIPVETRIWTGDWNRESVIFAMSRDVSLYEEAEEKFEKSFYKNPAVMAITDVNTAEYLDVNDSFIHKFGYSKQEVIGKTYSDLDIFIDNSQHTIIKELLLRNGEFSDIEVDVRAKCGSIFRVLFSGGYITTRNSTSLLTVMIDITENNKKDILLRTITLITQNFLKSQSYMETIPKALGLLGEALDVSRVMLFSVESNGSGFGSTLKPMAEWYSEDEDTRIENVDLEEIFSENNIDYYTPLLNKQPMVTIVKDMDESCLKSIYMKYGIKSTLRLPIFDEDVFWGFIVFHECRRERQWSQLEKNIMEVFLDSLTMAIQRYSSTEKIEFLSFHDYLTGLYNRRYYEQAVKKFDKEIYYPVTLVMADVNGLKLTNDAFGHSAGDLLLQKIASIIKRECRSQDIVARIGGDEFVVLLPKTDAKSANIIIERINKAISSEHIDNLVLSISIGFAVKNDNTGNMNDVFKQAEDLMYRNKLSESSSVRSKTIDLILNSLFEKNNREMLHSERVGNFCEAIAKAMNFSKDDVNQMRIAGLMHDIGKIGISETALNKPGGLLSNEWAEIKRHSEIGYRILGSVNEFSKIADYVLEHHEKLDGSGYPKGLEGRDISLQARIIALADAFDAMTSDRAYRKRLSAKEAIEEIKKCTGSQFDPEIAKIFVEKVLGEIW